MLTASAWALSIISFSTGDFLFDVLLSAEIRGRLPSVDSGSGGMAPLGQKPERRGGVGAFVCQLLYYGAEGVLGVGTIITF